jgi:Ca-activated chloride channel family protein
VRVHLGAALALHALLLLAGARWAPSSRAPALSALSEAAHDILLDAAPELPPPPAREEPPPPAKKPGGDGTGGAGTGEHRGAPGRGAVAVRPEQVAPPRTAEQPIPDLPAPPAAPALASDLAAKASFELSAATDRAGTSTGVGNGDGVGDGGGGDKLGGKRGGALWGESWDYVAGNKAAERKDAAVKADETTLPRKIIEGVVSRNAARLRACYQDGLRREPGLAGLIPVRFTVSVAGSVVVASDGGSTVADPTTVRCVLSTFAAMTFPSRAQGESVRATYLVAFPPG